MRHIERSGEPTILVRKGKEWQDRYDARRANDPKLRPDSSKYGHKEVREALESCSFCKCFYCESTLYEKEGEVDHFIEVSIAPDRAYAWENLYLSCKVCNRQKKKYTEIPVEEALNPCKDTDEEIQENITFEDECVCSRSGSQKGLNTIRKFSLNSELLDLKRSKWLRRIMRQVIETQKKMNAEGRKTTTAEEKEAILRYMQKDKPYSLMSEIYIKKNFPHLMTDGTL